MYYILLAIGSFGSTVLFVDWVGADDFGVVFWVILIATFIGIDFLRAALWKIKE